MNADNNENNPRNEGRESGFKSGEGRRKSTFAIAFAAMMCALGFVALLLGSIIETIDLTTAAIASYIIVVCMIELGGYSPILVYAVTSALALLFAPNKSVALVYALFFGFYPVLKKHLERPRPIFSLILKLATFNVLIAAYLWAAKFFFFLEFEGVEALIVVLMNVILFTFDFSLSLFAAAYVAKFRKMLRINKFFKR